MLSLRKQWPFWVSGVFVGVAEIMNYIVLEKPIGLTTGLVEMTAAFEQTVLPESVDWWSRAYDPNVHWIIIGVVVGALPIAIAVLGRVAQAVPVEVGAHEGRGGHGGHQHEGEDGASHGGLRGRRVDT